MPIYEYRCGACGHYLDALQKISDAPLSDCPACNKAELKRLISAPSFRLKGSGWYETDFKGDKERKRNLAESAGGEGGDKKSGDDKADKSAASTGSDSKSAAGSDKKSGGSVAESAKPAAKTAAKPTGSGSEAA